MDPLTLSKTRLFQALSMFMVLLSLVAVATFFFILKANKAVSNETRGTIVVEGKAERYVAPDLARISFTESQKANTAAAAQEVATKKVNEVLAFLKESGIEEKDIKTTAYQIYPVYEYYYFNDDTGLRCPSSYCNPPYYQKENIVGYRVEQSVEVKVRKVEDAGKIVAGIGAKGIQTIGGLSLEVEEHDKIAEEVKNEAIRDAREKAKERAKSLGVKLGEVIAVNDGYGGMYYARGGDMAMESKVSAGYNTVAQAVPPSAPAPEISAGENKIEAYVSVTYEIK